MSPHYPNRTQMTIKNNFAEFHLNKSKTHIFRFEQLQVFIVIFEQISIHFAQFGHECFQSRQIQLSSFVDVSIEPGQHIHIRFVQNRQCVRTDVQVRQMRNEIVAHHKAHENPIVNDVLNIVAETDFIFDCAELQFEILSQ